MKKTHLSYPRGLQLLFLLFAVTVIDASAPVAFSSTHDSYVTNNDPYQPSASHPNEPPAPNSIGNRLLLSGGPRTQGDTHFPSRAVQSKKLRSPINSNRYALGQVDQAPNFNTNVNRGLPPPTQSASTLSKSAAPTKTNRIREPFIGEGYVDTQDGGRSFQSRGPPGKVDRPAILNKRIQTPPKHSNEGSERRYPPLRLSRPENPFRNDKEPLSPRRDTDRGLRGPPNIPPPSPRPLPDYPPAYDQSLPQSTNSSYFNPNTADFPPFESKERPSPNDFPPFGSKERPPPKNFPPFEAKDRPSSKSDPFEFSGVLGGDNPFTFPLSGSFRRRPARPRPTRDHQPANLFKEFPSRLDSTYSPDRQSTPQVNETPQQRFPSTPDYINNNRNDNNKNNFNKSPRYDTRRALDTRGVPGYNAPAYGNRAQCFQYSFPAEAYKLSDLPKGYPSDDIQKELDLNPYLSPLVGLEAKVVTNDPFTFNAPISSHFDFSGFGFKNDATTSDKYGHLKNIKSYPGNMNQGDLVGRYPSSMQPLDSACPSTEFILRSFFQQGRRCYVINPDFQQINYHRCQRQDCNFCGVNRGLSACVENYRWVSVMAYCGDRPQKKRITPMRLFLPVGCSCQHFVC